MAASICALGTWPDRVTSVPELINVAAWSWLARERGTIHLVRPSVPRLVAATDLHQLPAEAPELLRAPWCVEVQRPERGEALWGTTWALAGYELDGTHYLVGLEGDGCHVVPWTPQWSGRDLTAGVDTTVMDYDLAALGIAGSVASSPAHAEWARQAVRWATVYALLHDAAGAPLRVTAEEPEAPPKGRPQKTPPSPWKVSRVTLTPDGDRIVEAPAKAPEGTGAGEGADAGTAGLLPVDTTVKAHIKRQRHGPGNSLERWIFVQGYHARRWVTPWTTRIVNAGTTRPS